jgi:Protein of unknown function (DUF1592)/Protein of unknown function (DUF1588)/Protein of unknown function (DUF1595)/Protein of unknown function (DUF1585)/Protein of unknown function (DUF1587)
MYRPLASFGLLFALGCVGSVNDSGKQTPPGGSPPPPGVSLPPATTCKADQIGISPLRRLTRQEYDNSIRDLLGVDLALSRDFSDDERAGVFPSNFYTPISESQFAQYAGAAAKAATKAVEKLATLLPCAAGVSAGSEAACASQFIRQFGRRAYRRPLEDAEVARYEALFKTARTADFAGGIEAVVQGMLESPHFIYLVEGPGALTQHQLAARLSYFLWNAPPDAQLATLADGGGLRTLEALDREAKRLLADPRAQDMLDDFHARWLRLDEIDEVEKDPAVFPEFEALRPAMREELRRFVSAVIADGGKLETLLTAPFTFANGSLAKLYGAKGGDAWQRVELDPAQRSGILTQSAFLAVHGHEGSAPIFRGMAVREQLLCMDLPPPPPGADQNLPPRTATQTVRQRLQQHRVAPDCASCHNLMDVMGYGFEAYDDIGRFRTTENGVKVDDTGEIIGSDVDGPFRGASELSRRLLKSERVQRCLVQNWFRYALGRLETDLDRCTIDSVLARFQKASLSIPELVLALVESDGFRVRRGEEGK